MTSRSNLEIIPLEHTEEQKYVADVGNFSVSQGSSANDDPFGLSLCVSPDLKVDNEAGDPFDLIEYSAQIDTAHGRSAGEGWISTGKNISTRSDFGVNPFDVISSGAHVGPSTFNNVVDAELHQFNLSALSAYEPHRFSPQPTETIVLDAISISDDGSESGDGDSELKFESCVDADGDSVSRDSISDSEEETIKPFTKAYRAHLVADKVPPNPTPASSSTIPPAPPSEPSRKPKVLFKVKTPLDSKLHAKTLALHNEIAALAKPAPPVPLSDLNKREPLKFEPVPLGPKPVV